MLKRAIAYTFGAAALVSTALAAGPSQAAEQGGDPGETISINLFAPPTCGVTAVSPTQTLTVSLIDSDGRVNGAAVQSAIVAALNAAQVSGFCTGANNTLVVTRTPFVLGTDGGLQNNFARAVLYDVQVTVDNNSASFSDSTADGPTGGSAAGVFGPTAAGAPFVFASASGGGALNQPIAVVVSNSDDDGPSASFSNRPNARLVAGAYQSTVTIQLTPGL